MLSKLRLPAAWLLRSAAAADDDQAGEDEQGGEGFLPCEGVHADGDAYSNGNDRLYVAVHADDGRSDSFLCYRNEVVCDERRADDKVGEFCILSGRDAGPVNVDKSVK